MVSTNQRWVLVCVNQSEASIYLMVWKRCSGSALYPCGTTPGLHSVCMKGWWSLSALLPAVWGWLLSRGASSISSISRLRPFHLSHNSWVLDLTLGVSWWWWWADGGWGSSSLGKDLANLLVLLSLLCSLSDIRFNQDHTWGVTPRRGIWLDELSFFLFTSDVSPRLNVAPSDLSF